MKRTRNASPGGDVERDACRRGLGAGRDAGLEQVVLAGRHVLNPEAARPRVGVVRVSSQTSKTAGPSRP
jgi:hypothetical protein